MATREELLRHLWQEVIDPNLDEAVPQRIAAHCEQRPDAPFADSGAAIGRLLALGADPRDLCLLMRDAAYEAVFGTLYALGDPGVDGDDVFNLHEDLLGADPSGREGRPASV
ncbi:hypothetical protein GLA29479_340 [Lysobacter antibioticus]|jgi:hypothetical protein|uniref:Uncharacterized protein n=1 Tax=Lysobacter antibioticus TaxID=84531 RepID=A0A0S2FI18_LYSAN|nr:hypothetical protein [Lysobacter antibioticus]ALN61226.1 hypothetical protein GLA29479_340 [Lysobacter antibioticus]ALN83206.1 hypothetical protein LA76x_5104 [Lysobacter antibioticus]